MKLFRCCRWFTLILIATPLILVADPGSGGQNKNVFASLDADNNGQISRQEMLAAQSKRFHSMDVDDNDKLSRDEFRQAMAKRYGDPDQMSPRQRKKIGNRIDAWFKHIDQDGDGNVTLSEYQKAMSVYFDRLDTNDDGRLTSQELKKALQSPKKK
ncbi:hypothetical protein HKX42_03050 [Salinisphaera sp. USBA-960]|uniref:EF-hand domain-containing protein n=1 Tax=Salinisphaera orenii TaxID=856731 RepID=UPI0013A636B9|nr:hypothetical protein [Salifodinibacter halophilus]NNC25855.1 hypothetical protein [Salifodinibacter halophilus]